ncbi:hypothetical protein Droror1_Dr00016264 [Drosera rotundifolia]
MRFWKPNAPQLPVPQRPVQPPRQQSAPQQTVPEQQALKQPLKELHQSSYSNLSEQILQAASNLDSTQKALRACYFEENKKTISFCAKEYSQLLDAEKSFHMQMVKDQWVHFADRNSHFFHNLIKCRRKQIMICRLMKEDGTILSDQAAIGDEIIVSLKALMGTYVPQSESLDPEVVNMGPILSPMQQDSLIAPFSHEDVKDALMEIDSLKDPSADDFTASFYKEAWSIIDDDVSQVVLNFLLSGCMSKFFSTAIVHLAPKCDNPSKASDFRPISCCAIVYKIIFKMLCRRLTTVLPGIITFNQSAFVEEREPLVITFFYARN